jgi:hypothetical protein
VPVAYTRQTSFVVTDRLNVAVYISFIHGGGQDRSTVIPAIVYNRLFSASALLRTVGAIWPASHRRKPLRPLYTVTWLFGWNHCAVNNRRFFSLGSVPLPRRQAQNDVKEGRHFTDPGTPERKLNPP